MSAPSIHGEKSYHLTTTKTPVARCPTDESSSLIAFTTTFSMSEPFSQKESEAHTASLLKSMTVMGTSSQMEMRWTSFPMGMAIQQTYLKASNTPRAWLNITSTMTTLFGLQAATRQTLHAWKECDKHGKNTTTPRTRERTPSQVPPLVAQERRLLHPKGHRPIQGRSRGFCGCATRRHQPQDTQHHSPTDDGNQGLRLHTASLPA